MGHDKDRKITYQIWSWVKKAQLRETNLIYFQLDIVG